MGKRKNKLEEAVVDLGFRRMVRESQLCEGLGVPPSTLRSLYTHGTFPRPVRLAVGTGPAGGPGRAKAFFADEVAAWQASLPRTIEDDSDEGEPADAEGESRADEEGTDKPAAA